MALIYGPTNAKRRVDLWGELMEMAIAFQGSPMLMGGDFNVTLEVKNRPNNVEGTIPIQKVFGRLCRKQSCTQQGQWIACTHGGAKMLIPCHLC